MFSSQFDNHLFSKSYHNYTNLEWINITQLLTDSPNYDLFQSSPTFSCPFPKLYEGTRAHSKLFHLTPFCIRLKSSSVFDFLAVGESGAP